MANKLIRKGYTQIIPANPGRPPTPARTVTTTSPVTAAIPGTAPPLGGGGGGSNLYANGSWAYVPYDAFNANSSNTAGDGRWVWTPA